MKNRYPDLAKQVVFITGAASGIGAAQAQAFLEQDACFWIRSKIWKNGRTFFSIS